MKGKKLLASILAALLVSSSVVPTYALDLDFTAETSASAETAEETVLAAAELNLVNVQAAGLLTKDNGKEAETIIVHLGNVGRVESGVTVKLYCGDTLLSTTTAKDKVLGKDYQDLSVQVVTRGDAGYSGSWATEMAEWYWYGKTPDKVVVTIDGETKEFSISDIVNQDKYNSMSVAKEPLKNVQIEKLEAEKNRNEGSLRAEAMMLTLNGINEEVKSVSIKLYHDDTLLSTTTGTKKFLGYNRPALTATIVTYGDAGVSESWKTEMNKINWYNMEPNKVVVTINGEEKTFENVTIATPGKYAEMNVAKDPTSELALEKFEAENKLDEGEDDKAEGFLITLNKIGYVGNSMTVKICSGDTVLSTTTLQKKRLNQNWDSLTAKVVTGGSDKVSDSWKTEMHETDWADKTPNKVVVEIDGAEKSFDILTMVSPEKYNKMEVALEKVAEVNGVKYSSLQKAFDNATNGATITLNKDIILTKADIEAYDDFRFVNAERNDINKITFDLGGHTISLAEDAKNARRADQNQFQIFQIWNADCTIQNGHIDLSDSKYNGLFFFGVVGKGSEYLRLNVDITTCYDGATLVQTNGKSEINGGTYTYLDDTYENYPYVGASFHRWLMYLRGNQDCTINGGTFVNFDPLCQTRQAFYTNSGLGKGKVMVKEGGTFTVTDEKDAVATITRNVTCYDNEGSPERIKARTYAYKSLAKAIEDAAAGETIVLTKNVTGDGIVINKDITIDLGGHTYDITGLVGSTGTESNGIQILKDNDVTIKNGKLTSSTALHLIQNYADLTLENVKLDGSNLTGGKPYTVSHNSGTLTIDGNSTVVGHAKGYAFDVCDFATYSPAKVVVENGAVITGIVNLGDYNGGAFEGELKAGENTYTELGDYIQVGNEFVKISERKLNISADETEVYADEEVTVSVTLDGANMANVGFTLTYDAAKFEYVSSNCDADIISEATGKFMVAHNDNTKADTIANGTAWEFTFKAIAQTEEVTGQFNLSDAVASTYVESINGYKTDALGIDLAEVTIKLREVTATVKVDGEETTENSKNIAFDGEEHEVEITTEPELDVTFKVNGVEADKDDLKFTNKGTYVIDYEVNKPGYEKVTGTFTLVIGEPDYVVEVDTRAIDEADYVAGKKIVLVYTNVADLEFTYGKYDMLDVTEKGYKYDKFDGSATTAYDYVYAFVTDAISDGELADYEANVQVKVPEARLMADEDLNGDGVLDLQDISVAYGVYNVRDEYFEADKYQKQILAADVNNDKNVTAEDTTAVVNAVINELTK